MTAVFTTCTFTKNSAKNLGAIGHYSATGGANAWYKTLVDGSKGDKGVYTMAGATVTAGADNVNSYNTASTKATGTLFVDDGYWVSGKYTTTMSVKATTDGTFNYFYDVDNADVIP